MLSIAPLGSHSADYYLSPRRSDYYESSSIARSAWIGSAAEALGCSGEVTKSALENLFAGYSPDGKRRLVTNAGSPRRRMGLDLSFSPSKSVSVLWSQEDPRSRALIERAHGLSVDAAMEYVETSVLSCRVGAQGCGVQSAKLVVATFQHGTSRHNEPQLHTHVLVPNTALKPDGSTGAVNDRELFRHKMAIGAIYRAELSYQLQCLGLQVRRERTWFEIERVPKALVHRFSTRRAEILEQLAQSQDRSARAAAQAALTTRPTKSAEVGPELFERWRAVGAEYGFYPSALRVRSTRRAHFSSAEAVVKRALSAIQEHQAHFSERELLRRAAEESQEHGIPARITRERTSALLASSRIREVGLFRGEKHYSTPAMLKLERCMLRAAEKLASKPDSMGTSLPLPRFKHELNGEQSRALEHMLDSTRSLVCVSGRAGTGKTYLLRAAHELWADSFRRVLGCALSSRAAIELEQSSGIPSSNVSLLLHRLACGREELSRGTVLVVDEAGMVGTADMARLLGEANASGAKVVLVGDERQLQPISAGGPFARIVKQVGSVRLEKIQRQRKNWARDAVSASHEGDAAAVLSAYARRGLLHVEETREKAIHALVNRWSSASGTAPLILVGPNLDATEVNRLCQARRIAAGELTGEPLSISTEQFFVGDRVVLTKNSRNLTNGTIGTIASIRGTRVEIRQDSGEEAVFDSRSYEHVKLAYAVTTHKAQGLTVDQALVLLGGPMTDREISYVQLSRARDGSELYTYEDAAGVELSLLTRQMERSRRKLLALDLAQGPELSLAS